MRLGLGGSVEKATLRSVIAVLVVVLIGAALAYAGSWSGHRVAGVPVYAIGVGVAFLVQWVAFVPAWLKRTETFYDLTGGLT